MSAPRTYTPGTASVVWTTMPRRLQRGEPTFSSEHVIAYRTPDSVAPMWLLTGIASPKPMVMGQDASDQVHHFAYRCVMGKRSGLFWARCLDLDTVAFGATASGAQAWLHRAVCAKIEAAMRGPEGFRIPSLKQPAPWTLRLAAYLVHRWAGTWLPAPVSVKFDLIEVV